MMGINKALSFVLFLTVIMGCPETGFTSAREEDKTVGLTSSAATANTQNRVDGADALSTPNNQVSASDSLSALPAQPALKLLAAIPSNAARPLIVRRLDICTAGRLAQVSRADYGIVNHAGASRGESEWQTVKRLRLPHADGVPFIRRLEHYLQFCAIERPITFSPALANDTVLTAAFILYSENSNPHGLHQAITAIGGYAQARQRPVCYVARDLGRADLTHAEILTLLTNLNSFNDLEEVRRCTQCFTYDVNVRGLLDTLRLQYNHLFVPHMTAEDRQLVYSIVSAFGNAGGFNRDYNTNLPRVISILPRFKLLTETQRSFFRSAAPYLWSLRSISNDKQDINHTVLDITESGINSILVFNTTRCILECFEAKSDYNAPISLHTFFSIHEAVKSLGEDYEAKIALAMESGLINGGMKDLLGEAVLVFIKNCGANLEEACSLVQLLKDRYGFNLHKTDFYPDTPETYLAFLNDQQLRAKLQLAETAGLLEKGVRLRGFKESLELVADLQADDTLTLALSLIGPTRYVSDTKNFLQQVNQLGAMRREVCASSQSIIKRITARYCVYCHDIGQLLFFIRDTLFGYAAQQVSISAEDSKFMREMALKVIDDRSGAKEVKEIFQAIADRLSRFKTLNQAQLSFLDSAVAYLWPQDSYETIGVLYDRLLALAEAGQTGFNTTKSLVERYKTYLGGRAIAGFFNLHDAMVALGPDFETKIAMAEDAGLFAESMSFTLLHKILLFMKNWEDNVAGPCATIKTLHARTGQTVHAHKHNNIVQDRYLKFVNQPEVPSQLDLAESCGLLYMNMDLSWIQLALDLVTSLDADKTLHIARALLVYYKGHEQNLNLLQSITQLGPDKQQICRLAGMLRRQESEWNHTQMQALLLNVKQKLFDAEVPEHERLDICDATNLLMPAHGHLDRDTAMSAAIQFGKHRVAICEELKRIIDFTDYKQKDRNKDVLAAFCLLGPNYLDLLTDIREYWSIGRQTSADFTIATLNAVAACQNRTVRREAHKFFGACHEQIGLSQIIHSLEMLGEDFEQINTLCDTHRVIRLHLTSPEICELVQLIKDIDPADREFYCKHASPMMTPVAHMGILREIFQERSKLVVAAKTAKKQLKAKLEHMRTRKK
jgi:hypothetical protein